jgi:helicase required for RNAi-mediated heterochromatin assembly 1
VLTNRLPGLGREQIVLAARALPTNLGLPLEEIDLEFEQMQNLEEEATALRDDTEKEALSGEWIPFDHRETSRYQQDVTIRQMLMDLFNVKDMYLIPRDKRGRLYRGFEKALMDSIQSKLKPLLRKYRKLAEDYQITKASFKITAL